MNTPKRIAVISAGLGKPSSTRMLADRLALESADVLRERGVEVETSTHELRDIASDITNNMLTGFPSEKLEAVIADVTGADGLIVVSPVFSASYSGLFKSFFDVLDPASLAGMPVLIGATAGTARHSLVLDHALRPLFSYLRAIVLPTGVFAATDDWGEAGAGGQSALTDRIARAAGELAPLVEASERSSAPRDPFGFDSVLSPVGGFQPN
ncbi:FMN reductase [Ruicaihuangia caeni]|uniref:FMN reductase n=1 Tax=Ruicaihuangia caeni TaxID=3042517 RepID=A0AAW6TE63_9MICO|nr:FMN reductase [Klugiella sp. YN-L-19]MDI2099705.1 FMN reductase [Klugiella sp. YN-L-19]